MNLVIDSGNTRFKAATFSGLTRESKHSFQDADELKFFLRHHEFDFSIVSSVAVEEHEIMSWINSKNKLILSHSLPLPIQIKYQTVETLGTDRLAAVCGAIDIFPDRECLVIDAGSCITYDFIDRNKNYYGGAISPGIAMRFEALHTFTKRLPLISANGVKQLVGDSTENCIRSGVLYGACAEMEGFIYKYLDLYSNLGVILCGGDISFFENNLKPTIFAAPDLVLSGLNRILLHNAAL